MGSWGRGADASLSGTGTIANTEKTITGSNTAFTTELDLRDVITVGGTTLFVVTTINSDTEVEVEPVAEATQTGQALLGSQTPKYLSVEDATQHATYVTVAEAQDANNRVLGVKTPGWTIYEEYGSGRKRVETLVAMKSTS